MRSTALSLGRAGLLAATAITVPIAGQEGVDEVIVTGHVHPPAVAVRLAVPARQRHG